MKLFALFKVLLLSLGFFLSGYAAFPKTEVDALISFKSAITEDPLSVFSNWNTVDSSPCHWCGIYCSMAGDHVLKLNISGKSLKGYIAPELNKLSTLQELILNGNLLMDSIPSEIGLLKNLKVLDLGSNRLTGKIPPEIGNLSSILKINLESNGLTGKMPSELGNLKYLAELRLDRNRLLGTVPACNGSDEVYPSSSRGMFPSNGTIMGFCRFSQLKVADFSYNFLVGYIPKCLSYLPRSSFQGNCLQDKDIKQRSVAQCVAFITGGPPPPTKAHTEVMSKPLPTKEEAKHQASSSKPTWLLALEISTGVMMALVFVGALFTAARKLKGKPSNVMRWNKASSAKDNSTIYLDSELLKDVTRYSRQELEVACEDFSNIIGSSPDSLVYKGTIKGGAEIAVISLCSKDELWTGYLDLYFQKEVAGLARLNHENVGKLLGYCRESSPFTRMLVFEYASNGTLYELLHYGEACQFSWTRRMKIIVGIARGLKYLHMDLDLPFTISELNSSSIYLTDDFSPKLVDFECWKTILSRSEKSSGSLSNEGPICIIPNSLEERNIDIQGNTYAFGILLLEIISGRPPSSQDKGCLVDWAKEYLEFPEVMPYVVDPELKHFRYEDLKVICEVVGLCIYPKTSTRASMRDLCSMLENGIDTSVSAGFRASSMAWAELALSL